MEIIKFRGKRTDNKEWIYGFYIVVDGKHLIIPEDATINFCGKYGNGCFGEINHDGKSWTCEVDPKTVSQFIMKVDKNGKEIYEGDIIIGMWDGALDYSKEKIQVEYKDCAFRESYFGRPLSNISRNSKLEVIGNIIDNPELLNQTSEIE